MGGAHFYWRVTLVEGRREDGIYALEQQITPLGEQRQSTTMERPYKPVSSGLTHSGLVAAIPFVGTDIGQRVLGLTPEQPRAVFDYERHMGI
ncbi:MAG: hypothetical protein Q7R76_06905 [Candidatus Woesearchaeota archaeon]|nr:hypothetical protein [Candidatus Woesearchaeota archaeon]